LFGARVKGGEDLATLLEVALEFATETGRRCFFPDDIPVLVPECLVELDAGDARIDAEQTPAEL
jgi:hypothetical protein